MSNPNIKYDEISDTLTISFESGVEATGIELTEHILLRINKSQRKAISINIFEYSVLSQKTEMGIRSFPIAGLAQLSREMQEIVFDILLNEPVSKYLHLSAYTLSLVETIPIVSVQSIPVGIEG
ncbi:DUF2283 domain-containing protein [Aerosakkonemataceae cyanobacterium BLCC-F50]|uniref:DUF2283 domain-containing protein n=1 Tax=Floridaenema flaviceps BLCC-F50 TaxID=3153642 RepID=A0ABV4XNW2_9CYAN